ncbi:protein takeout-like [Macrosteles quadrilineatus]|uniref:protein takeout-like n=1 Tax=Macrosteles quadrilineatus TaxID=74068 RepID=UPI0023E11AE9|nr:protein takeout-like [Macrosteles quadrilineatus]XP_054270297.1 protein takeout-like [Macrosteles quadrilineatus]
MAASYLLLAAVLSTSQALKLPWYTPACSRNDPNLNDCVVKHGQQAIPHFINGDPKYRVPKLDPLVIDQLAVRQGTRQVGINLMVRECKIYGLKNAQFIAARTDLKKRHIEWDFKFPSVFIRGIYNITGQVLILPIMGNGHANITINDLTITYKYDWVLNKKGSKHYMNFTKSSLDFDIGGASFYLENLFNGDKLLGENMNYFLNQNWREVTKELGPAIGEAIGEVFRLLLTNIADLVPYEYIYPDTPANTTSTTTSKPEKAP